MFQDAGDEVGGAFGSSKHDCDNHTDYNEVGGAFGSSKHDCDNHTDYNNRLLAPSDPAIPNNYFRPALESA